MSILLNTADAYEVTAELMGTLEGAAAATATQTATPMGVATVIPPTATQAEEAMAVEEVASVALGETRCLS